MCGVSLQRATNDRSPRIDHGVQCDVNIKDILDVALYAYVGLIVLYRAAEITVMRAVGSLKRRPKRDWTMALIVVPYTLVMVGPLTECV